MAKYKIRIKKSALKELEGIAVKADRRRIVQRITSLAENPWPQGCQKLSGRERYRIGQGPYRIIYSIEQKILTVFVIKVGHRKDVYRDRR